MYVSDILDKREIERADFNTRALERSDLVSRVLKESPELLICIILCVLFIFLYFISEWKLSKEPVFLFIEYLQEYYFKANIGLFEA